MKKIAIIALTRGGCQTALRLGGLLPEAEVYLKAGAWPEAAVSENGATAKTSAKTFNESLAELISRIYGQYDGFVMIMAAGIVFRTFAPYVVHKSQDPAVVVLDERARFAISLLSGHLGGANQLARRLAELCSAHFAEPCQAVITTATDVRQKPAFDLLAQQNDCYIANLAELKYISGALVNGRQVALCSRLPVIGADGAAELPPDIVPYTDAAAANLPELVLISHFSEDGDWPPHTLRLVPRHLVLGVGCKRGAAAAEMLAAAADFLAANRIEPHALCAVASVDLKRDEPGILALAEEYSLPFLTYPAAELQPLAEGMADENKSDFVLSVAGTPSVAQAAALLAAGGGNAGRTLVAKTRYPGITFSLAEKPWAFKF